MLESSTMNSPDVCEFVWGRRPDTRTVVAGAVIGTDRFPVSVPLDHRQCRPNSAPSFAELLEGGRQVALYVARSLLVMVVVVLVVPKVVEMVGVARRLRLSVTVPRCSFHCCSLHCCILHLAVVV